MAEDRDERSDGDSGGEPQEDRRERVNRELIELLNELRVALPGVQVLFAFLLAVPFSQGFGQTTSFQRDLFFGVLAATAASTVFFIAPSAWHRINFRQRDKERMLLVSNRLAIAGLAFLALAMVGVIVLIADYVFSSALAITAGCVALGLFALFWMALPLTRRGPAEPDSRA
jgi:hypothetical protein